jgi:hypothetical protein
MNERIEHAKVDRERARRLTDLDIYYVDESGSLPIPHELLAVESEGPEDGVDRSDQLCWNHVQRSSSGHQALNWGRALFNHMEPSRGT